jgi:hypothetical protein
VFLGVVVLCGVRLQAQTFDEWFEQNKTRKKYQEQQIGELQLYITALEGGYKMVESGLSTIGQIKKGEFDLHNSFYTSLRTVSPAVSGMPEAREITALQAAIVQRFSSALTRYNTSAGLRPNELASLTTMYGQLKTDGSADVTLLGQVLTDNTLEMSDDQRIRTVLAIDGRMRDRYKLTVQATDVGDAMIMQRTARAADAGVLSQLYGLP